MIFINNRKSKYPFVKILNESERKRILISGGAGFVGSHLVDRLMNDGHEVLYYLCCHGNHLGYIIIIRLLLLITSLLEEKGMLIPG